MADEIKSGKEIVDEFFNTIEEIPGIDSGITGTLKDLYKKDKLTHKSLSNALLRLRLQEEKKNE